MPRTGASDPLFGLGGNPVIVLSRLKCWDFRSSVGMSDDPKEIHNNMGVKALNTIYGWAVLFHQEPQNVF